MARRWVGGRLAPRCGRRDCDRAQSVWNRLRNKPAKILIQGSWYCQDGCAERALDDAVRSATAAPRRAPAPRRIPLGLLLLSRHHLTVDQLRAALEAQRTAGRGRIGEWLQSLGFVNELQVTAALARQCSCPVLQTNVPIASARTPRIPATLLESFFMTPIDYVEATGTLHVAFGENVDYGVLYAIEQMLGCRTEPCLAVPSLLRRRLEAASRRRDESEVIFDRVADGAEVARIVRSYSTRVAATEIRLAVPGSHLWVRLLGESRPALDILLRFSHEAQLQASLLSSAPANRVF